MLRQIFLWFDAITDLRAKLFVTVDQLYEISSNSQIVIKANVIEDATNCHLRPTKKDKSRKTGCCVCISNKHLKMYEGTLFSMTQRTKNFEEMSLKGSWKPTFQELTFKCK